MSKNTNFDFLENYSGAKDLPDSRDYTSEEIHGEIGASIQFPSSFFLEKAENLEQGRVGACTIFGSTNAYNEKYAYSLPDNVKYEKPFDPWKAWEECKRRGASDTTGFVFQSALQVLKDLDFIGAYIRLGIAGNAKIEKIKTALYLHKSGVATGLPNVNWRETLRLGEYTKGSYYGQGAHIFDIVGWDDNKMLASGKKGAFFVKNSWGNGGEFWISYEDIKDLYSQYEFLLTSEQEKYIEARKKRRTANLQKAYEKKIWNEKDSAKKVEGIEARKMVNRALGLPDDYQWMRKTVQMLAQDKISRGKILIAQTGRDWEISSDFEFNLIMQRHITRNPLLNVEVLTREQFAEVIGRDFL